MNYEEAVAYILDVPRFTKKNTLDNTRAVLERLGRPDRRMKLIHVAGTNGKGSGGKADGTVHFPASGRDQRTVSDGSGADLR